MRGCQCPGVNECLFLPSATDANARRYISCQYTEKTDNSRATFRCGAAAGAAPAVQGSHPIVRAFRVSVSVEGMRLPLLSVFLSPTDDIARDARPHSSLPCFFPARRALGLLALVVKWIRVSTSEDESFVLRTRANKLQIA